MTLARTFNMREGFTVEDDQLCPRSYSPTQGGALAEGGIDLEELREAIHTYYVMMGWDRETGMPTVEKLQELDIAIAERRTRLRETTPVSSPAKREEPSTASTISAGISMPTSTKKCV